MSAAHSPMDGRPPLQAALFDAGGTLVRLDFEWMSEAVTSLGFPLDASTLRHAEIEGRRAYDASRGHPQAPGAIHPPLGASGDTDAYFEGMLAAAGVPRAIVEQAVAGFLARHRDHGLWSRPLEGARAALDATLAMGLRIAVVSNSDGRAEQHLIESGVRAGLEFVVDSQVVGIEKPDPRIFRFAIDRLGIAAERTIYVGDLLSIDARGARAAGLQFVLVDPYDNYAPIDVPSISGMELLPRYLLENFDVGGQSGAPASSAPTPNRAVP
ncbi:MAG TPA: HAD family hydrolase [Candidatus Sulfotelmatobacter sp.]|nr:HAD family hydrolase [Candidatus Sulfotelmatobacter sp.]